MAKSKGHVSPAASERGNYPFPVREQQMIAEHAGGGGGGGGGGWGGWRLHFQGLKFVTQKRGEGALIFWQLYIYFYHVFPAGHLLYTFFSPLSFSPYSHGGTCSRCFYACKLPRVYLCALH